MEVAFVQIQIVRQLPSFLQEGMCLRSAGADKCAALHQELDQDLLFHHR